MKLKLPAFILALTLLISVSARAQVTAVPANDFLNSLGINTHIGQGDSEASYEPLFTYTGIRNDRDKITTGGADVSSLLALHNNTVSTGVYPGVMFNIHNASISDMVSAGTTLAGAGALLSFEGDNEPNTTTVTYNNLIGGGHAFPAGITVSTTTGVISGTPTTAGLYAIAVTAKNATGTGVATFTLIVNPTASVPVITSAAQVAASNSSFTYNVVANNTPTSYSASFLPPGLSINTTTGAITGTPTPTSGTYTVTLGATNSHGTGQATLTITINPTAGAPIVNSAITATATVGTAFSYSITGTNTPTSYNALASYVPVAQYQRDYFSTLSTNSTLENYPVFGVSEDGDENDNVGLQFLTIPTGSGCIFPDGTAYFDYANCHNYVDDHASYTDNRAWLAADPSLNQSFDGMYGEYTGTTWNKHYTAYATTDTTVPKVTTETGWGTIGTGAITQAQQAALFLDLYLSQYKRGWAYTFIYELRDGSGGDTTGEGIYNSDSTPKTAATDIHNFTTILQDTVSSAPGSMNYTIPSEPSTVHDLLLQNSNGTYYLIVWDEKFSTTGNDSVTVNLGATAASVLEYDPTISATVQTTLSNVSSVALTLKDHPIILAISGLGLPSPWVNQDIGSVGVAGSSTYSGGTFTVNGSGAGITGTADAFQYAYQPITGDCTITARLATSTNSATAADAGVMIRESLAANSTFAAAIVQPGGVTLYLRRATTGGTATVKHGTGTVPLWVRAVRSGTSFTAYTSTDGTTWTAVGGAITISMASNIYLGLAQCSAVNTTLGTSTFDNVTVTSP